MNSSYLLLSIAIYSFWKVTVISERSQRYPIQKHPIRYSIDVLYFSIMLFFLSQTRLSFLILGFANVFIHVLFGIYIELFRPEYKSQDIRMIEVMENYWNFIMVDALIILGTYSIVLLGGYNG